MHLAFLHSATLLAPVDPMNVQVVEYLAFGDLFLNLSPTNLLRGGWEVDGVGLSGWVRFGLKNRNLSMFPFYLLVSMLRVQY